MGQEDGDPSARATYTAKTGLLIDMAGFVDHPTVPMSQGEP